MSSENIEKVGKVIVDAAVKVHKSLGPGLLETAYQKCLEHELMISGLKVESELQLPIKYGDIEIETGYRLDMLVNNSIIIENKTVEKVLPIHEAQLLTYMKMKNCRLGYLLN
jgi:GxxExxY protein